MAAIAEPPKKAKSTTSKKVVESVNSLASLAPMMGETQGQFFDRAFRAIKSTIPQVNQRTVEILKLWQQSQNDQDLREAAATRFPADRFMHFGPRCIFLEHVIPDAPEVKHPTSGAVVRKAVEGTNYDRVALQKMVDFANYRIRNAGQFAAISDGHMPTPEEKSSGQPDADVLGYSGPFYLGLFGNVDPQWAIFSDEWVHNDDVARFQKLQRRSPEVWHKEPIERRTMDPIAALGSETPRLDSGMNLYCLRAADGQEVMRYSMAMALPGPNNSYVPGAASDQKKKYGANSMIPPVAQKNNPPFNSMDATQAQPSNDSDTDQMAAMVAEIVSQLMPSIVQSVQDKLSANNPTDGDAVPSDNDMDPNAPPDDDNVPRGVDPSDSLDGGDVDNGSQAQANGQVAQQPPAALNQPATSSVPGASPAGVPAPNKQSSPAPSAPQAADDDQKKYAAMSPECGMAYAAGLQKGRQSVTTNYSKGSAADDGLANVVASQAERIKALEKQMQDQSDAIAQERSDAMKYSRLVDLSREYAFDPREEMELVADMSEDQFERFATKGITKYARRDSLENVELFDDQTVEVERYSRGGASPRVSADQIKKYQRQAEDVCLRKISKGEKPDFNEEFAAICKTNGVPI